MATPDKLKCVVAEWDTDGKRLVEINLMPRG